MSALVLVVEDEPMLRISLMRGLAKLDGITVVGTGTVADALAVIDQEPPGLIVSDIDLPDASGLELVSVLDEKSLSIPVLYASAYVDKFRSDIPVRSNVSVLEKPVPLAELRELVAQNLPGLPVADTIAASFRAEDYLQLACMCRKTVEIVMHREAGEVGYLIVREGELWGAVRGEHRGTEAVRRLVFDAADAKVSCVGLRHPDEARTIYQSWESVLLDAARTHDEDQALAESSKQVGAAERLELEITQEDQPTATFTQLSSTDKQVDEPSLEFEYEKRERRLREYEQGQPELSRPRSERVSPPTASNYLQIRFEELYEEGVEALLNRDYARAATVFAEANNLVPADSRVVANLKRLGDMGYTKDEL